MTDIHLLPLPACVAARPGNALDPRRPLVPRYELARTPRLERAVARLVAALPASGPGEPVSLVLSCGAVAAEVPVLGDDESYAVDLSAAEIRISAVTEWGMLHGLTTLLQLLSAEVEVAAQRIEDAPQYPWRGLMLDVARHFLSVPALLRTLDAMAAFKLNVLHLHLSDDQGFRFPSTCYPRLPSVDHYRRSELAQLVRHAADRGIRVVPELDMPGHTTCWLTAYPQWGNRKAERTDRFGVHEACLDPTRPQVREAVAQLLGEVADVFPDAFLHVGGDEVHPAWWSGDEHIQAYMGQHGLADVGALQAHFNRFLAQTISALGRRMIGWDELLHPDLPADVTVQAWRGATARDRALAAGLDCVVSAPYYLDLFYPVDVHVAFDPAAPQADQLALEDALLDDPRFTHVAGGMAWTRQWRKGAVELPAGTGVGSVLGGEACLWAELVDERVLNVRLWSRLPALAERFWAPAPGAGLEDLWTRLRWALLQLPRWAGVDVAADVRAMVRAAGVKEPWWPLVEMLEPVKWYGRLLGEEALAARLRGQEMPRARPYRTTTPLDRVADALPPESTAARDLRALLRRELDGDADARARLQALARQWCDLPAAAGPGELAGPAARLTALGELTLAVLGGAMSHDEARRRLQRAATPQGEYLLAPVWPLTAWVEARIAREQPGA